MSETLNEGQQLTSLAMEKKRWYHRRMHAYLALGAILIITGILLLGEGFVSNERVNAISDIMGWVIITLGSVIVGYAGFNTLEAKMSKGSK